MMPVLRGFRIHEVHEKIHTTIVKLQSAGPTETKGPNWSFAIVYSLRRLNMAIRRYNSIPFLLEMSFFKFVIPQTQQETVP